MPNFEQNKCLLDLPILPYDRDSFSDDINEAYINDVESIDTEFDLRNHVHKWRSLWLLKNPNDKRVLSVEEQKLLSLEFNFDEVIQFLKRRKEDGLPFDQESVRIMTHLLMPAPLLQAFMLASHFGVCTDLAMVRLYLDQHPEFEECCRGGSGDLRQDSIK